VHEKRAYQRMTAPQTTEERYSNKIPRSAMDASLASITTSATMVGETVTSQRSQHLAQLPVEPIPTTAPESPVKRTGEVSLSSSRSSPEPKYDDEEPLYTEINIPLPPIPKPRAVGAAAKPRAKSHSISSFRPFHRRGSSSDSTGGSGEEWPRVRKQVKSREVAAAMNVASRGRRSGTVDALAVVPAVLMLSAELFTPGQGGSRTKEGGGRWQDGMI